MQKHFFSRIRNPLTIVALFVGLSEVAFSISLWALPEDLRQIIAWFLVIFPSVCALFFFLILLVRPLSFYGPSDFKTDQAFLEIHKATTRVQQSITNREKPQHRTGLTISLDLSYVPKEFCTLLLQVAERPMEIHEYANLLEPVIFLDDPSNPNDSTEKPFRHGYSLGFVSFGLLTFFRSLFVAQKADGDKSVLVVKPDIREMIAKRIAQVGYGRA
jgi:hypothetical protein